RTAIVYDLGGGTFDVTVVSIEENNVRIVCTDGDHRLGGKDWDDRIVKDLMSDLENELGESSENCNWDDPETSYELRLSAENAKKTLTNRETAKVRVVCDAGRVNVDYKRERFEQSTSDLLERTVEFTRNVLNMAREKGIDHIDDFLLVGGSTRMPMVAERIRREFEAELGCAPQSFDVDEAVAKGAAWFGYCQTIKVLLDDKAKEAGKENFDDLSDSEKKDVAADVAAEQGVSDEYLLEAGATNITTVATKSYGIRALDKTGTPVVHNMILRQTPTPVVVKQSFRAKDAAAPAVELRVFSSNETTVDVPLDQCEELGLAELNLPPGLPARTPVEVTFDLSPEGALKISGSAAGSEVHAEFKAETGMSADEVQEAKERSKDLVVE
ncbi:MAG: Hsp70 family protein, partial [Thermoguttaceae bacterium]|nr:Hsp70 family protein [Thermoguttaceae bacterium]